ncbi:hypothetical protein ACPZ19_50475 [Amycolatopsis lurida]
MSKPWFPEGPAAPDPGPFQITALTYQGQLYEPEENCVFHPKDQAWTSNGRLATGLSTASTEDGGVRFGWTLTRTPITT